MKHHSVIKTRLHQLSFFVGNFNHVASYIARHLADGIAVLPCDLHNIAVADSDPVINKQYQQLICTTDGMPLVWYFGRKFAPAKIERVYGPDLMKHLLSQSRVQNFRHLFFGADHLTLQLLKQQLATMAPSLKKVSFFSPPVTNVSDLQNILEKQIDLVHPNIIWLGIGSPKQVFLAAQIKKSHPKISIMCVGAAFDFLAGTKKTSPRWLQQLGLEWLFRMFTEPNRLYKRYLKIIPSYLFGQGIKKLRQTLTIF